MWWTNWRPECSDEKQRKVMCRDACNNKRCDISHILDHLSKAPPLPRNLLNFDNSKPAKEQLVSHFCLEVMKILKTPESEIEENQIAQPKITKLQILKPTYNQRSARTINWQPSVKTGIISFIMNVLLYSAISYWVKLRLKISRLNHFRVK